MKFLRPALAALLFLVLVPALWPVELTVFAAASLSDALREIAPLYQKASGNTLRFNFGASGALSRQIKEGAPADVIFSADELRLDQLEKDGLLAAGTRRTLLTNTLVLVVAADGGAAVATLADLDKPEVRRIAIGDPATVPVGTYTKEYLQKTGGWTRLSAKMVPLESVRAALAAVESGNADAGFVYKTDALISRKVRVALAVAPSEGPRINYPVAVVKGSGSQEAAANLVGYLAGAEACRVFEKYGFALAK